MSPFLPGHRPIRVTKGGSVAPGDIVGRDQLVARWWDELEASSLRLNEPRRMGKSSALMRMEALAPPGWVCVRRTVQDATSTRDLVEATLTDLRVHATAGRRIWERVSGYTSHLGEAEARLGPARVRLAADFAERPFAAFERILQSAAQALAEKDQRLAIIWDEFPDAILSIRRQEGDDAAADVLAKFRALREGPARDAVRFVVAGSAGFHHVVRGLRGGHAFLNDLTVVDLGPLDDAWGEWLAQCLLMWGGRPVADGEARAVAQAAGNIPFLMEHLASLRLHSGKTGPLDAAAANDLLTDLADSGTLDETWSHLLERADQYYGPLKASALAILDNLAIRPMARRELAASPGVEAAGERLGRILELLSYDHYVTFDRPGRVWRWRYEPLRRIWQLRRER